jgi:predicted RNA-binding Zn ribbon-like protein
MPDHYVVIDGLALPARLSGHPALDFCNTLAGWNAAGAKDYLTGYESLVLWAEFVGLLPGDHVTWLRDEAAHRADAAERVVGQARKARGRMYEVLLGREDGATFDGFAADFEAAAGALGLSRRPDQTVDWEIRREAGLAAPLHAVVCSASRLLTSSERARVTACPGTGCGWLFLNRSGRRRWCTMATCGNRAKVRAFAARQRSDESA